MTIIAKTARVPMIDPRTATGETARYFDTVAKTRGRVANSKQVWAHLPYIAKFHQLWSIALRREGAGAVLSSSIKEMAVLKTSHVNRCSY